MVRAVFIIRANPSNPRSSASYSYSHGIRAVRAKKSAKVELSALSIADFWIDADKALVSRN